MATALNPPTSLADARDLRRGGRWTPGQRSKNGLIRTFIRAALWVADRIPIGLLRILLRGAGWAVGLCAVRLRRRARQRVQRLLPGVDAAAVARASFATAGASLADCLALRRDDVRALELVRIEPQDEDALRSALAPGRGAVVACAHLGPFELVAAAVAELGLRPAVLVRESYDPALDPLVDQHRVSRGVTVIHRGDPGAATRMVRVLREGRPLGLLPDLPGRVPTRRAPLLASDWSFAVGPARLACRVGAPLLSVLLVPAEAGDRCRYRMTVTPVPAGDELEMTRRIALELGAALRLRPESWLWMASEGPQASSELREIAGIS